MFGPGDGVDGGWASAENEGDGLEIALSEAEEAVHHQWANEHEDEGDADDLGHEGEGGLVELGDGLEDGYGEPDDERGEDDGPERDEHDEHCLAGHVEYLGLSDASASERVTRNC